MTTLFLACAAEARTKWQQREQNFSPPPSTPNSSSSSSAHIYSLLTTISSTQRSRIQLVWYEVGKGGALTYVLASPPGGR
jgi:hypothetical protein